MRDSASALHRPLLAPVLVVVGLAPPLIASLRGGGPLPVLAVAGLPPSPPAQLGGGRHTYVAKRGGSTLLGPLSVELRTIGRVDESRLRTGHRLASTFAFARHVEWIVKFHHVSRDVKDS